MLFTAEDNTFPGPGKIGLWTKADSITRFDSLVIHKLQ
jgi:superoxide dismutase